MSKRLVINTHFDLLRMLLGLFLVYHFFALVPYVDKIQASNTHFRFEYLGFVILLLGVASTFYFLNVFTKQSGFFILLGLLGITIFFPMYYDIDLDYIICLLFLMLSSKNLSETKNKIQLYNVSAFILGLGYAFSGVSKLSSPVWQSGSALQLILSSAEIYRFEAIKELIQSHLWISQVCTWFVALLEAAFLPLVFYKRTRFYIFAAMTFIQILIGVITQLTEINIAVLLFHFLLFDKSWLKN